jgi:hypothetical protein
MKISDFFKQVMGILGRLHEQSHTRHLTFAQRIADRVKTLIIDVLGANCPAQVTNAYTGYQGAVDYEDDTFKIITKSPRTEEIQAADTTRDNTWSGVLNYLDFMQRLGSAEQQAAAKRVLERAQSYKIVNNARYEDQNTNTMQWIQQCEGVLAADITTLNMGQYISKLKTETQAVIDLIGLRNQEMANIDPKAMQPARQATEDAYVLLVGVLNAHAITECVGGVSPYDEAINVINSDIDYYVNKVFTTEKPKEGSGKGSGSSSGNSGSQQGGSSNGNNGSNGNDENNGSGSEEGGGSQQGGSGDDSGTTPPSGGGGFPGSDEIDDQGGGSGDSGSGDSGGTYPPSGGGGFGG